MQNFLFHVADYWKEKVEKNREWIIDDEKYKLLKE